MSGGAPRPGSDRRAAATAALRPVAPVPFSGVVLTGGRSTRMGTDKAFLAPDDGGPVLAERARRALAAAGAREILAVGGDLVRLRTLGFSVVPDRVVGRGPLGGLISGLQASCSEVVVVLSCDLPTIDGPTVAELVRCLARRPDAGAALPVAGGRCQVLVGAYRRSVARVLDRSFRSGERSIQRALGDVVVAPVPTVRTDPLLDVDRPEDLARYARSRRGGRSSPPSRRPGRVGERSRPDGS